MSVPFAHSRFAQIRHRLENYTPPPGIRSWVYEFLLFGFKQGWACLFGGLMLSLLFGSFLFYPDGAWLHRYDFVTLCAVFIQLAMLALRLETWSEAKVILLFHIVGTIMELFKTANGSWIYPEPALLKIGDVPLFSGFMYAAVGSYIARVTRIFDMRYSHYPPQWICFALAAAIYLNFFTHHYIVDVRTALFALCIVMFARTWVYFRVWRNYRRMPLLIGFLLVALFIYFAENIGTFARAWNYPGQQAIWKPVGFEKLGSWYLLMIISFVLTSVIHKPRPPHEQPLPGKDRLRESAPQPLQPE